MGIYELLEDIAEGQHRGHQQQGQEGGIGADDPDVLAGELLVFSFLCAFHVSYILRRTASFLRPADPAGKG